MVCRLHNGQWTITWSLNPSPSWCCEWKTIFAFIDREIFSVLRVWLLSTVNMDHPVFVLTRNFLWTQDPLRTINLLQTQNIIFRLKNYLWPKWFFDPNYFQTQIFFRLKFFSDPNFFQIQIFFWTENFKDPTIFWLQIFLNPNVIFDQFFLHKNVFGTSSPAYSKSYPSWTLKDLSLVNTYHHFHSPYL